MESIRQQQVAELVKRNFAGVLQSEGSYIYGSAFVTVTQVRMSPDLGLARIYCSVYNVEDKMTVIQLLRKEHSRLRQELGRRLKRQVRRIPEIEIFMDETLDEMHRLNKLFDTLHSKEQMGEEE